MGGKLNTIPLKKWSTIPLKKVPFPLSQKNIYKSTAPTQL